MQGQEEDVVTFGQVKDAGAPERSTREVEGRGGFLDGQALGVFQAPRLRDVGQVMAGDRDCIAGWRIDDLHGRVVPCFEAGAQTLVPCDDAGQAAFEDVEA